MKKNKLVLHMIANAHLDPIWLWNWQAGVDEAIATFRSAADRCDEYPEFIYTRGEAWLYEMVEKHDPILFARVKECIKRGQWSIAGGQFIQPDANLPTEYGWNQQIAMGQAYFKSRFGTAPKVGYNVDTFGHPATLPDLLAGHGYTGYVFHRPNASQIELPASTFVWKGIGGAELIGFRITPCYVTRVDELYGQIMMTAEATDPEFGHALCFYGLGNHGGGPTKESIEYIIKNKNAFPGIELKFGTVDGFFEIAQRHRKLLPVVTKELQHCFPGCYSVMHDIKQAQQRGEALLNQASTLSESLETKDQALANRGELERAWKDLLFTQFHDILAGTSIPSSWGSVRAMQGRARIIGEEIVLGSTRRWARRELPESDHQQMVMVNGATEKFNGFLEFEPFIDFDNWGDRWVSDEKGKAIPYQLIDTEANMGAMMHRLIFPVEIKGKGSCVYLVRDDKGPKKSVPKSSLKVSARSIENKTVKIQVGSQGIRQIFLKGKPLLKGKGISLHLRKDAHDTWVFRTTKFNEPVQETLSGCEWKVEEKGPLRGRLFTEAKIGSSQIRWTVSLLENEARISMKVEVLFGEKYTLLQMPVFFEGDLKEWRDGLAGGSVSREPSEVEWPMQKWSRIKTSAGALSAVTPDWYSSSLNKNVWQFTLLRSPLMAWPGERNFAPGSMVYHTDQGWHSFESDWIVGASATEEKLDEVWKFQTEPPVVFDRYQGMNRPPWGDYPPRRLWTPDIPRAVKDGKLPHLVGMKGPGNFEESIAETKKDK